MKKRKLVATLLALIMVVAVATTSANAVSRPWLYPEPDTTEVLIPELVLNVSVDTVIIPGVDVYQGLDGSFRVYSFEELEKIFPTEFYYSPVTYVPREGIILDEYIKLFGYTAEVTNNTLCIYKSSKNQTYEVYFNNFYAGTTTSQVLPALPDDCQVVYSQNRIYINNNGKYPIEVKLNGTIVKFPDQQPIILTPGRTMVPIRAVAELLGCKVEWNSDYGCAVVTRDSLSMYLFPNQTSYLLNGNYYDMDVAPTVLNGRTMVPIRFVAEAFGFKVGFQSGFVGTVTLDS